MGARLRVSLVNEDTGTRFSDFEEDVGGHLLHEDGTPDMGALFRVARAEYGRCTSSVYAERQGGPDRKVGWYFLKRDHYDDSPRAGTYLRGAWVVVETAPEGGEVAA